LKLPTFYIESHSKKALKEATYLIWIRKSLGENQYIFHEKGRESNLPDYSQKRLSDYILITKILDAIEETWQRACTRLDDCFETLNF